VERFGLPLIVKPATQGSSVGMSRVDEAGQMQAAFEQAIAVDRVVFAEPWVTGAEYTVAVLHRRALPAIRIETARAFYDYEAKYNRDDTQYNVPCGLPEAQVAHMQDLAVEAFEALGCRGWGRIDFLLDSAGAPYVLEANTAPGMTDHSLVPMAARADGVDYDHLVLTVAAMASLDAGSAGA
jgi:D-alanine-D-alanine ligase